MTGGDGVTHAVLPFTAGKLHVECSPTLKLGEPGLSGGHGPRLAVVVRAFWAIVGGQEVLRRKVSLRCAPKPVRRWCRVESQNQL